MWTLKEMQDRLGLSRDQNWRLINAVSPILEERDLLRRERGRSTQISPQAIDLLERAKVLHDRGTAYDDLATVLRHELEPATNRESEPRQSATDLRQSANGLPDGWQRYVEHLESELERRDETIGWLQGQLEEVKQERDEFRQLALPDGDRRPWWRRIFRG